MGESLQLTVIPGHPGFLLAILAPGAFIGQGLLIAGRNWLDSRISGRRARRTAAANTAPERSAAA
jgi:electron transport complex protein RnfE